ncbi:MAG: Lrp/AsnC ligand binding domain-containing protein [Candidatus Aerophobetes bacterium]|nr:Lrp/AsnC ligand binding domain-containing protein [Candidatus Aerophobetes bacterium]
MQTAFILINADAGKTWEIIEGLKKIEEVVEVYSTAGEYDIIAKIIFPNLKTLGEIVPKNIQNIRGIKRTNTLLTFEVYKYRRYEPCKEARELEDGGEEIKLYRLCKKCKELESCIYGQQVIKRGIEPTPSFNQD